MGVLLKRKHKDIISIPKDAFKYQTPNEKLMKGVIYSRVSTEEQDPKSQLTVVLDYAKERGYEIVRVFEEKILAQLKNEEKLYHKPTIAHYYATWLYDKGFTELAKEELEKARKQLITIVIHKCE